MAAPAGPTKKRRWSNRAGSESKAKLHPVPPRSVGPLRYYGIVYAALAARESGKSGAGATAPRSGTCAAQLPVR